MKFLCSQKENRCVTSGKILTRSEGPQTNQHLCVSNNMTHKRQATACVGTQQFCGGKARENLEICPWHAWWRGGSGSFCFFQWIPKENVTTLGKGNSSNVYKKTWRFNHLLEGAGRGKMSIKSIKWHPYHRNRKEGD